MEQSTALVLLSSGLDSSVCLAIASRTYTRVETITFDYGQQAKKELESARKLASHFGAGHRVVRLPWFQKISRSALTGHGAIPDVHERWDPEETARRVWVPSRNLVFVSIASAFLESMGGGNLIAGFNREEGETFPDNSEEFVHHLSIALRIGSREKVILVTPLIRMDKSEIARMAVELAVPLEKLWFCYHNGEKPCFRCESCTRFLRGFEKAGLELHVKEKFGEIRMG